MRSAGDSRARLIFAILAHHSKSFALAGKLLPRGCREDAAALYAWCRRCDDAVDSQPDRAKRADAVSGLRRELDAVYSSAPESDPVLGAMQEVVRTHQIPRRYPDDLISGMEMDVDAVRYRTMGELLLYCYRAAGTVGLMMAHVMGARQPLALRRAAHLGIAMQLTNICRDVGEDEQRGRVYLPHELLLSGDHRDDGEAREDAGETLPTARPYQAAYAVNALLREAERFYASGQAGLRFLPLRCGLAIRAAALIYREIGRIIVSRKCDVRRGRAVVSTWRKSWLLLRAVGQTGWFVLGRTLGVGTGRRGYDSLVALPFVIPGTNTASESDMGTEPPPLESCAAPDEVCAPDGPLSARGPRPGVVARGLIGGGRAAGPVTP